MKERHSPRHVSTVDNRGVSQIISFILIFALISSTVGVVTFVGFDGLTANRDAERVENAERAFDVVADNIEDIYREDAPSRATEVKLSDATLTMGETATVKLIFDGPGRVEEAQTRPLVFETNNGDSKIVYEAGAVLRVDGDAAVMLEEPPLRFDKERTSLTVVSLSGSGSIGGDTTALVRAKDSDNEVRYPTGTNSPDTPGGAVTFRFETTPTRAIAWERYLESEIDWVSDACTIAGGTVRCELTDAQRMNELYLTEVVIEVDLE